MTITQAESPVQLHLCRFLDPAVLLDLLKALELTPEEERKAGTAEFLP